MAGAGEAATPLTAAGVVERVLSRLLTEPAEFCYGALVLGDLFALVHHRGAPTVLLQLLALSVLTAAWLPAWIGRRRLDPTGRAPLTIGLALFGSVLVGSLLALHNAFAILALSTMAQYFIVLPFWVAVLCGVGPGLGSEYSHRLAVLAAPDSYPWAVALFRTLALAALGVSFKVLAIQIEERGRLQDSLARAERRAGMLEERQRLAREIHDTLAQDFASIAVHLEHAEQLDLVARSPAHRHVELARSLAREGLEESRRMLGALRPELLEQRALPEALGRVCAEWSRRTGVAAGLSVTGTPSPMHPEIELTVLRAVQEALTNIMRHAGARTVAVTLSYMEDVLVLDVQDDGRGFTPAATPGGGFGLAGMKERTERLAGAFSVESVPGEGTTISLTLPVVPPVAGEPRPHAGAA